VSLTTTLETPKVGLTGERHWTARALLFPILLLPLWLAFVLGSFWLYEHHPNGAGDYRYYDRAARLLIEGKPFYDGIYGDTFLYPPLLAITLEPLVAVTDYEASKAVWFFLNVGCLLFGLGLLGRHLPGKWARQVIWIVTPLFAPVWLALLHGQITIVLFLLIVGAWAALRHDKHGLAGALLALAAWIKIYPGVLLLYLLWKRDWQAVRGALVFSLIAVVVQLVLAGPHTMEVYLTEILPQLAASGQTTTYLANVGILGFAARLFSPMAYVEPPIVDSPLLLAVTRYGFSLLVVIVILVAASRRDVDAKHERRDLEYALVLIGLLLVTSSIALSGMVPLLLVIGILVSRVQQDVKSRRLLLGVCAIAVITSPIGIVMTMAYVVPDATTVRLPHWAWSAPFFGMVVLFAATAFVLYRANAKAAPNRASSLQGESVFEGQMTE
jgi:hypothetical protein